MGAVFEEMLHQRPSGWTHRLRPVQKTSGRPLQMVLVSFGHMLSQRGMAPFACTATMRGDALAFAEDFNGRHDQTHVDDVVHETMRDTVEMPLDFEMIIEMNA